MTLRGLWRRTLNTVSAGSFTCGALLVAWAPVPAPAPMIDPIAAPLPPPRMPPIIAPTPCASADGCNRAHISRSSLLCIVTATQVVDVSIVGKPGHLDREPRPATETPGVLYLDNLALHTRVGGDHNAVPDHDGRAPGLPEMYLPFSLTSELSDSVKRTTSSVPSGISMRSAGTGWTGVEFVDTLTGTMPEPVSGIVEPIVVPLRCSRNGSDGRRNCRTCRVSNRDRLRRWLMVRGSRLRVANRFGFENDWLRRPASGRLYRSSDPNSNDPSRRFLRGESRTLRLKFVGLGFERLGFVRLGFAWGSRG